METEEESLIIGMKYDIIPEMRVSIPGTDTVVSLVSAKCAGAFPGRDNSFIMEGAPLPDGRVPSFVQRCGHGDDDPTKPRVTLILSAQQDCE